jgi:hypothetical protein
MLFPGIKSFKIKIIQHSNNNNNNSVLQFNSIQCNSYLFMCNPNSPEANYKVNTSKMKQTATTQHLNYKRRKFIYNIKINRNNNNLVLYLFACWAQQAVAKYRGSDVPSRAEFDDDDDDDN